MEQDQLHRVLDVQVSALGTAAPGELASVSGPSQLRVRVNRRLLLTAAEHLSAKQWKRLGRMLDEHDPTNEIGAAWGVKERLRMLLAESEPSKIRRRLADFYDAAIDAQLPEATRLADTIQTWWPAILVALTENASNARTEGFNRIIKQTKRVGCGYRNMINYQRRILSHCGHPTAVSSMNGTTPRKFEEPRMHYQLPAGPPQ